jgi:hypothetical protein
MTLVIALPEQAIETPAFDTRYDRYHLYFNEWQCLDLLPDAAAREWQRLPRWARAQFEASVSKLPIVVRDTPTIERLDYVPERGEGCGQLVTASWQPHHRENADTDRADIFYSNATLAPAEEWWLPEKALRHRPIVLCRPGEYLLAARTAVELALEGERCAWVDVGDDLHGWQKRLKKFELILPKRIYHV